MNYTEDDFESMTYNVYSLDIRSKVLSVFPKLNLIPTFKLELPDGLNRDKVLRYIIFMYDDGTPLSGVNNDRGKRTADALELAHIFPDEKTKAFNEDVEKMINFEIEEVNKMIVAFLRSLNSPAYTNFKVQEMLHNAEVMKAFSSPDNANAKRITDRGRELKIAQEEFLKGDNNYNLVKSVYELIWQEDIGLSPEVVIRRLADGEEIFKDVKASSGKG